VLRLAAFCATVAVAIGAYLTAVADDIVPWLMAAGALLGAYAVQSYATPGYLAPATLGVLLAYGLPGALLVVAILHANNHRDRDSDRHCGARTLANLLTPRASLRPLWALLGGAYGWLVVVVIGGLTTPWVLLAMLSLPLARRVAGRILAGALGGDLVPSIVQLHGLAGVLTALGVGIAVRLG
jgi:1,4-dihydroxy-2-naphthoate octaprenyltransferase